MHLQPNHSNEQTPRQPNGVYNDLSDTAKAILPALDQSKVWADTREPFSQWIQYEDNPRTVRHEINRRKPGTPGLADTAGTILDKYVTEDTAGVLATFNTGADVNGRSSWHMRLAQGMPLTEPLAQASANTQNNRFRGDIHRAMNRLDGYTTSEVLSHDQAKTTLKNRLALRNIFNESQSDITPSHSVDEWVGAVATERDLDNDDTSLRSDLASMPSRKQHDLYTTLTTAKQEWERKRSVTDNIDHALNGGDGNIDMETQNSFFNQIKDDITTYARNIMDWAIRGSDDNEANETYQSHAAPWNQEARSNPGSTTALTAPVIADYHDTPRMIRTETTPGNDDLRTTERVHEAINNEGLEKDTSSDWAPSQAYRTTINDANLYGAAKQSVDQKAANLDRARNLRILGEDPEDHIDVTEQTMESYDALLKDSYVARHSNKDLAGAALDAFNDKVERRRTAHDQDKAGRTLDDIATNLDVTKQTAATYLS